jgi:hypothetical protein
VRKRVTRGVVVSDERREDDDGLFVILHVEVPDGEYGYLLQEDVEITPVDLVMIPDGDGDGP